MAAAVATYIAASLKELSELKDKNLPKRKKPYSDKAKKTARTNAKNAKKAAILARKGAKVAIVTPPALPAQDIESKDRIFEPPEFYANLFGWRDERGEKKMPELNLIKEIKDAIILLNPDFDQLKKDVETLSCGTKFRRRTPNLWQNGLSTTLIGIARKMEYLATWAGLKRVWRELL